MIKQVKKQADENGYYQTKDEEKVVDNIIKNLEEKHKQKIKTENFLVCLCILFLPIIALITIRKRYGFATKTFAGIWACVFFFGFAKGFSGFPEFVGFAVVLGIGFFIGMIAEKISIFLVKLLIIRFYMT